MVGPFSSRQRVLAGVFLLAVIMAASADAQRLTFNTFAGPTTGAGFVDATGTAARFSFPEGVAVDGSGNVYVAEFFSNTIRRISPAGAVTTLAGLTGVSGGTDGSGGAARFILPRAAATDSAGNVYVADILGHTIRKITPTGVVTTLAGASGLPGSTDGVGSAARFNQPGGVATDGVGNVYVADTLNHTIRKITPAGVVTTLAGSAGLTGSADGIGAAARFRSPTGVATDGAGNVYVGDRQNHTIRMITPAGVVTTLAGAAGLQGSVDGAGTAARFRFPSGLVLDGSGMIYVADQGNHTIRTITPAGIVTTLAGFAGLPGSADGTGSTARFDAPQGVAIDGSGNVVVADRGNSTIRKVTSAGVVTTFAGSPGPFGSADGSGTAARFNNPSGIASDAAGNMYVADTFSHTIRKITPTAVVITLAGTPGMQGSVDGTGGAVRFGFPTGVASDAAGTIYVADRVPSRIRKVTAAGVVTTMAGSSFCGSADGVGSGSAFCGPSGLAVDASGNVYVADTDNHTIRKITPVGVVSTVAGLAATSGNSDGTGSAARFHQPTGVVVDGAGNLFVADQLNNKIRKITPTGLVTTLAGSGVPGHTDGTGGAATFFRPWGLTLDGSGDLLVAEHGNNGIRKVTPAGVVTTIGGVASPASMDGTGTFARFVDPVGVAVDSAGNVYVAERGGHRIRIGRAALADDAVIDAPVGPVGALRQLETSPQTATSWLWEQIRRPSGSSAALSSTSVRNPTFIPDVVDVYVFRLTATDGALTSITSVTLSGVANQAPVALAKNVTVSAGPGCDANASIDDGSFDPDGGTVTLSQAPLGPYPLGTTPVLLTVTDDEGAMTQATANVTVVDATAPSLSLPSAIVAEFADENGAAVSYLTSTSDNCPGVALSCFPVSGSLFPIGMTIVTCTATDGAANTTAGSFTITVLGARGTKQNAFAELQSLESAATDHDERKKLSKAAHEIGESLDPSLWVDETHVHDKRGGQVFQSEKNAVEALWDLAKENHNATPDAVLQALIDRILRCDRLLATIAIADAVSGSGDPRDIDKAIEERATGDEAVSRGKYASGIEHYRNGWAKAIESMK